MKKSGVTQLQRMAVDQRRKLSRVIAYADKSMPLEIRPQLLACLERSQVSLDWANVIIERISKK